MPKANKKHRHEQARIAVLVDRSRDERAARYLVGLEPDDVYHTTDNRVHLTWARLRAYDVLVVAGHGPATYSKNEIEAMRRFVKRGGGLLLAASTGYFERYAGGEATAMAVNQIGGRFGIEFLPTSAAKGRLKLYPDLVRGYPDSSLRMHRTSLLKGLLRTQLPLEKWAPVRGPRHSMKLLSHRRTGEAAAVALSYGKGRVVALGDASLLEAGPALCRRLIDHLAAKSPKCVRKTLPYEIPPPVKTRKFADCTVRYSPCTEHRLRTVLRILRKVVPGLEKSLPPKKRLEWLIELEPSCSTWKQWTWSRHFIHLGVDCSDEMLAFSLGYQVCDLLLRSTAAGPRFGWTLQETALGPRAFSTFVALAAMRLAGFKKEADRLAEEFDSESRKRSRNIDLGFYYPHEAEAPGFWILQELSREFGDDLPSKLLKVVPEKFDRSLAPESVFTSTDMVIHFLSRAVKKDLFPWFAELGATVHPLPNARFGTPTFKKGVRKRLSRMLRDSEEAVSERNDALEALIELEHKDKKPLRVAARQLKSPGPETRLLAAARLAKARDERGMAELEALSETGEDAGMAAIAALRLADTGSKKAGAPLARLAAKTDVRFQLSAGQKLKRIGHARWKDFSLRGIQRRFGRSAARLEVEHDRRVAVFPTVNGQHAANIFSVDGLEHQPGNTHVSSLYIDWVHTARKFRRMGLSRLAMERTFRDARARRCSCAFLGTGTRNTAHALYRSFGFVDVFAWEQLTHKLPRHERPRRVKGISVRLYRPGDEKAMADLFNRRCCDRVAGASRARPSRPSPLDTAVLAWKGRKLVAYAKAVMYGREKAEIDEIAFEEMKNSEDVAAAMMPRLHKELRKQKASEVSLFSMTRTMGPLLGPLGYTRKETGGVRMFKLIDLPLFLKEMTPLLERRLEKHDWNGAIALCGRTHRAGLRIENGRIKVLARVPARPNIRLSGSDVAITKVVTGIDSPMEPYLQLQLKIRPALNDRTLGLLEALFPRVEQY